ncbi:MAG TPA: glycerol-3-phosphate 1-O-acyltransferase PlsY [Thermoanaerobaculia bacterium]|nr:glycerol-3-phosphate 1-O-acyltransferase PlsY [Thermoanaerobaculia bacterium]
MKAALIVAGSYLLGSVSFSYLIVRYLVGEDIRSLGSGNAGATNVLRTTGTKAGLLTLLCDVGKGAGAVAVAKLLDGGAWVVGLAALAVVAGHCFPVFLSFRGGKGVATGAGVAAVLTPLPLAVAILLFALVVWRTGYVALGSLAAAVAVPTAALGFGRLGWGPPVTRELLGTLGGVVAMIVFQHRINLRRLREKSEARLSDDARVARRQP